jgi:hypothetical protein
MRVEQFAALEFFVSKMFKAFIIKPWKYMA